MKKLFKFSVLIIFYLVFTNSYSIEVQNFDLRGQKKNSGNKKILHKKTKIDSRFYKLLDSKIAKIKNAKSETINVRGSMASMGQQTRGISNSMIDVISNNVVIVDNWIEEEGKEPVYNGMGSGLVIHNFVTNDNKNMGIILTNWHVIEGASFLNICFKPKQKILKEPDCADGAHGVTLYYSIEKDLAVVGIYYNNRDFNEVNFSHINNINQGDDVFAIGHPNDNFWSYSKGYISQLRENTWSIRGYVHKATLIQTQTPLNPGNSGGPLVNSNGELVGVVSFVEPGENLNFAIAINDVEKFLDKTIKGGDEMNLDAFKQDDKDYVRSLLDCNEHCKVVDDNNNNLADAYLYDSNKNGVFDTLLSDENEDGYIELVAIDKNENEIFEKVVIDTDGDEIPDVVYIDENEDKEYEMVGYDNNKDGEIDTWEPYVKKSG